MSEKIIINLERYLHHSSSAAYGRFVSNALPFTLIRNSSSRERTGFFQLTLVTNHNKFAVGIPTNNLG